MITMTADELNYARSWIGTTEDDDTFLERFDRQYRMAASAHTFASDNAQRTYALNLAVEESMRAQLSVFVFDGPSSASADGDSYSNTTNMTTLRENIKEFKDLKGSGQAGVTRLVRGCHSDGYGRYRSGR